MLLVLVLIVWGIIGYKVLSTIKPSVPELRQKRVDISFKPDTIKQVDTFSITAVNRDPFLGTLQVKKEVKAKKTITGQIEWKPILYHGNISKRNTKTHIFIISIDGQQFLMKQGQVLNNIKLISGNSKQIKISFKGSHKIIKRR